MPLLLATALLSPVVFLALLEVVLRGVGFGGSYPLFVDAPGMPGHLQANQEVMRRYFPWRAPKVAPEPIPFAKRKPKDGYRLVVQGGSTAAGFPYGRWASLAGMLGDRLGATFPDRDVEVISTAMAAVNSYTLLDFVDEIVAIHPDAVLIYAGHNEYMGVMGVGSGLTERRSRAATLLHLRLRRFRFYQYLQALVAEGREALAAASQGPGPEETLMTRAAKGVRIPYGSELRAAGRRQFEANLADILKTYREAGIPVYLGTLVSNEKDRPPFAGDSGDPDGASAWYARGRRAQEAGDLVAAREAYRNARDRDELPFRAPEAFNEVLRSAAARDPNVTLVDVESRFVAASPDGLVGNELMLEHVHPNAEGYFLLADAYYDALRDHHVIGDWSHAPSREEAHRDMPITAVDRLMADYSVREIESDFPFTASRQEVVYPTPKSEVERLALRLHRGEIPWIDAMERLLQIRQQQGDTRAAAVVARLAAQAYPTERAPNYAAGVLLLQQGHFARARRYLERSLRAEPGHVPTLRALVRADRALGDEAAARAHLAELGARAPGKH